jgi:general secretion pathway protein B
VPVAPRESQPAPAAAPAPVTRLEPSPGPVVVAPIPPAAASAIELRLQAHVYSETPSQRMVFIDGRRYGEGDRIDGDTVLERITAEGAVVNRRGQRFTISDRR